MAAHVQQPAPHFACEAVVSGEFKNVSLDDYKGKYLILFFYPLDFTFVCPTEILAFNDRADEFRKIGCEVVGASVDSKFSHLAWINTPRKEGGIADVTIPLLADIKKEIARDYGVLLPDGVALRGLFVIDPKRRGPAHHHQRSAHRAVGGRGAARRPGRAVRRQARRGVPGQLEPGQGQHEARPEGLQGVLQEGRLTAWRAPGPLVPEPPVTCASARPDTPTRRAS